MKIRGTVLSNIVCKDEWLKTGKERGHVLPTWASIRFLIQYVNLGDKWIRPDLSPSYEQRQEGIKEVNTILEISYRINIEEVSSRGDIPLEEMVEHEANYRHLVDLQERDLLELDITDDVRFPFYMKKGHLSKRIGIKKEKLSLFVKVLGHQAKISWVEHLDTLSPNKPLTITSPEELINHLVYQGVEIPQQVIEGAAA